LPGVAALIWAARPELKNYQVADIIKQTARRDGSGWTPTLGCGVLDAGAALELATSSAVPAAATAGQPSACSAAGAGPPAWPDDRKQEIRFDRPRRNHRPTELRADRHRVRGVVCVRPGWAR
jgi:hypothetical protein